MAIRYPKAAAEDRCDREPAAPFELGKAEVLRWGGDGMLVACGTLLGACAEAAERLADEGLDFGVINARFVKPLDRGDDPPGRGRMPLVVTVEEGHVDGRLRQRGAGGRLATPASTPATSAGSASPIGSSSTAARSELLADLGLDAAGILRACRQWVGCGTRVGAAQRAPAKISRGAAALGRTQSLGTAEGGCAYGTTSFP